MLPVTALLAPRLSGQDLCSSSRELGSLWLTLKTLLPVNNKWGGISAFLADWNGWCPAGQQNPSSSGMKPEAQLQSRAEAPKQEGKCEVQQRRFPSQSSGQDLLSESVVVCPGLWQELQSLSCTNQWSSAQPRVAGFQLSDILWWYHFSSRPASGIVLVVLLKMLFSPEVPAGIRVEFLASKPRSSVRSRKSTHLKIPLYLTFSCTTSFQTQVVIVGVDLFLPFSWTHHWGNLLSLIGGN